MVQLICFFFIIVIFVGGLFGFKVILVINNVIDFFIVEVVVMEVVLLEDEVGVDEGYDVEDENVELEQLLVEVLDVNLVFQQCLVNCMCSVEEEDVLCVLIL